MNRQNWAVMGSTQKPPQPPRASPASGRLREAAKQRNLTSREADRHEGLTAI